MSGGHLWWARLRSLIDTTVRQVNAGGPLLVEGLAYAAPQATAYDLPVAQAFGAGLRVARAEAGTLYGYTGEQLGASAAAFGRRYFTPMEPADLVAVLPLRMGLPVGGERETVEPAGAVGAVVSTELPPLGGRAQSLNLVWTPARSQARGSNNVQYNVAPGVARYRVRVLGAGGEVLHDAEVEPGTAGAPLPGVVANRYAEAPYFYLGSNRAVGTVHALSRPTADGEALTVEFTLLSASPLRDLPNGEKADTNSYPAVRFVAPNPGGGLATVAGARFAQAGAALLTQDSSAGGGAVARWALPLYTAAEAVALELPPVAVVDTGSVAQVRGLGIVSSVVPANLPAGWTNRQWIVEFTVQRPAGVGARPHELACVFGFVQGTDAAVAGKRLLEANGPQYVVRATTAGELGFTTRGVTGVDTGPVVALAFGTRYRLEFTTAGVALFNAETGLRITTGNRLGAVATDGAAVSPLRAFVGNERAFGSLYSGALDVDIHRWIEWSTL